MFSLNRFIYAFFIIFIILCVGLLVNISTPVNQVANPPALLPTPAPTPPVSANILLSLVSQYRVANRLSALTQNSSLCQFSQIRLNEIISKNDWSHNGFWPLLDTDPPNSNFNYQEHFPWMGENLSYGPDSSQGVLSDWIRSPEHLANLVNPHYTQACVAVQFWPARNGFLTVMNYGSDDAYATQ